MAEQIKDTNVIQTPDVVINPIFFLPPDVVDMRSGANEPEDLEFPEIGLDDVVSADDPLPPDDGDIPGDSGLPVPDFEVVQQIVRIAPDGNAVVDLILEFDDNGGEEYDVRVTKEMTTQTQ